VRNAFGLAALLLAATIVAAVALAQQTGVKPQTAGQAGVQAPSAGQGRGGAGISPERLGPQEWVIAGWVRQVKPNQSWLVVSTDIGTQPLEVTENTVLRDKNSHLIRLKDLDEGDRVLAAFHREGDRNVVGQLYKLGK
jgi:hypothetical protein